MKVVKRIGSAIQQRRIEESSFSSQCTSIKCTIRCGDNDADTFDLMVLTCVDDAVTFVTAVSLPSSLFAADEFELQHEDVVVSRPNCDLAQLIVARSVCVHYVGWCQWQPKDHPCNWSSVFLRDTDTVCRSIRRYPKRKASTIVILMSLSDGLSYPILPPRVPSEKMTCSVIITDNQHCMRTCHSDNQTRWVGHLDISVVCLHFIGSRIE